MVRAFGRSITRRHLELLRTRAELWPTPSLYVMLNPSEDNHSSGLLSGSGWKPRRLPICKELWIVSAEVDTRQALELPCDGDCTVVPDLDTPVNLAPHCRICVDRVRE